jgi:hypothetical protein
MDSRIWKKEIRDEKNVVFLNHRERSKFTLQTCWKVMWGLDKPISTYKKGVWCLIINCTWRPQLILSTKIALSTIFFRLVHDVDTMALTLKNEIYYVLFHHNLDWSQCNWGLIQVQKTWRKEAVKHRERRVRWNWKARVTVVFQFQYVG